MLIKKNHIILKIKELRRKKNLTQDDIVQLSGIKKWTYENYERGNTDISLSKLQKIATVLEVSISSLIDEESKISEIREAAGENVSMYEKQYIPNSTVELIIRMGLTQKEFANKIGVPPNYVSRLTTNKVGLGSSIVKRIIKAFPDVNIDWFFTREGNMFKNREAVAEKVSINEEQVIPNTIAELIKRKGLTQKKFANKIGLSRQHVNSITTNKVGLGSSIVKRIIKAFPDVNIDWLFTHEGNMFKNREAVAEKLSMYERQAIPLVRKTAVGGFGNSDFSITDKDIKEKYVIPKLKHLNVDFMIEIQGSSMYPKYAIGDVIACRIIRERSFIQWNKTHLVATRDLGLIVKRIHESKNRDSLAMVSDNKKYKPFDVPKDEITGLALVVGVVRLE